MFSEGQRSGNDVFRCIWRANEQHVARLGLAVSRRVSPRATDRNLIKRIVRERFRKTLDRMPAVDIVVVPRAPAAAKSRAELAASIDQLLERVIRKCAAPSSS